MKLESNQIGYYEGNAPTRCAVSGVMVNAGAVQFSLDSDHYVLVDQTHAHKADALRDGWRNQVKPSKKTTKKEDS